MIQHFSHLVSPLEWIRMRPEQRREDVTQFDKATMKSKKTLPPGSIHASASTSIVTKQPSKKSVSAQVKSQNSKYITARSGPLRTGSRIYVTKYV